MLHCYQIAAIAIILRHCFLIEICKSVSERGGCTIKISTKVECGIIALIDIALHSENGEAVAVSSISNRQNISVKYLEQILAALRQAYLIRGIKGFKGGYMLARPANHITFQEIIDALDITVLSDVDTGNTSNPSLLKATVQESLWDQMTTYLRTFCAGITLQDMIDRYRSSIPPDEAFMYYI